MSVTPVRLPPSSRDFEIYRLVTVKEMSQRQVAAIMQLSPTRIRQIVEKAGEFISAQPYLSPDQPREQKLRVAEFVASERVNMLFGEALRSWENSQGLLTSIRRNSREGEPANVVETSHPSQGKVQYLNAALRYALAAAKLPAASLNTMGVDADDEETLAELPQEMKDIESATNATDIEPAAEVIAEVPSAVANPPVRDCAPKTQDVAVRARKLACLKGESRDADEGYDRQPNIAAVPEKRRSPPAHEETADEFLERLIDLGLVDSRGFISAQPAAA